MVVGFVVVVVIVAELSLVSGSKPEEKTLTVLPKVAEGGPKQFPEAEMVNVNTAPTSRVLRLRNTLFPEAKQLPVDEEQNTLVKPEGTSSSSLTLTAGSGPMLVIVMLYVTESPGATELAFELITTFKSDTKLGADGILVMKASELKLPVVPPKRVWNAPGVMGKLLDLALPVTKMLPIESRAMPAPSSKSNPPRYVE
jgi:hypothetical protein